MMKERNILVILEDELGPKKDLYSIDGVTPKERVSRYSRYTTLNYHLKVNSEMIPVRRSFFLGTLAMKEWSVRN